MKYRKIFGALLLIAVFLFAGCSTDALVDRGVQLLDKVLAGDSDTPKTSLFPDAQPPSPAPDEPGDAPEPVREEPDAPEEEPVQEPSSPAGSPEEPLEPAAAEEITPSHTDITFFGPGENVKYLPQGISGVYACTYASEDASIASVDPDTGKITAVGPGTTKVSMHVEYGGQYDFECIVRCSWKEADDSPDGEPSLPQDSDALPASKAAPADGAVSASHYDATFFNPKEHFTLLPVGAGADCACTYTTADAAIASVSDAGVVTAVGPGTTTVTMRVDAGGTEYIFKCIVRCSWEDGADN